MTQAPSNRSVVRAQTEAERRDRLSYVWGAVLALVLTALAFALVQWPLLARPAALLAIGALALVQMGVHFFYFLHLGGRRKREDLLLILFAALMLIVMVSGTLWIMGNLGLRMAPP